ncbi:hypothetical protein [Muricoccus vinaceus]|uniref:Uncharacterized protein n=1 Tax=Muricoccus vinaceus TaxID=424704 RepID=A0ABV6IQH4_9PROT
MDLFGSQPASRIAAEARPAARCHMVAWRRMGRTLPATVPGRCRRDAVPGAGGFVSVAATGLLAPHTGEDAIFLALATISSLKGSLIR